MKRISDAGHGQPIGVTVQLTVELLGERSFLVDTAARGLLLKRSRADKGEPIEAPEWAGPGPGIQTGLIRKFRSVIAGRHTLAPAVAEILQEGWVRADGILSPAILDAWRVHLDFRGNRLKLQPHKDEVPAQGIPWANRLSGTWWIVEVELDGKPARMLLDSGVAATTISRNWPGFDVRKSRFPASPGIAMEVGIAGQKPFRKTVALQSASMTDLLSREGIDGLLGFDLLHRLSIVLDYHTPEIKIIN
jgi:hypothetical protein